MTITCTFPEYGAWLTLFFVILPIFFPFTQLTTQKIKTLKERKKCLVILLFYTCVPQIIWCMVPEIWSATDTFFVIVDHFLPGYSSTNPENQNFEKMKRRNAQKYFLSFWATFCPLAPLKTTKFFKKWKKKKPGDTIILHKCIKNHDHMLYCSWDIASDGCNCYFSFWGVFCPFTPITAHKNQNEKKKKEKNARKYSSFYICSKNCDPMMYGSWVMVCNGPTDGQMDRKIYL